MTKQIVTLEHVGYAHYVDFMERRLGWCVIPTTPLHQGQRFYIMQGVWEFDVLLVSFWPRVTYTKCSLELLGHFLQTHLLLLLQSPSRCFVCQQAVLCTSHPCHAFAAFLPLLKLYPANNALAQPLGAWRNPNCSHTQLLHFATSTPCTTCSHTTPHLHTALQRMVTQVSCLLDCEIVWTTANISEAADKSFEFI